MEVILSPLGGEIDKAQNFSAISREAAQKPTWVSTDTSIYLVHLVAKSIKCKISQQFREK
jgi:hypothetical protein